MKQFIIIFIAIVLVGLGVVLFITQILGNNVEVQQPDENTSNNTQSENGTPELVATSTEDEISEAEKSFGTSVDNKEIPVYHYGTGDTEIMFVGGIHGGYSWNTVLVAYELMDYLDANPDVIPENVTVTVVPVLNPDGLEKVVGTSGRFTSADVTASASETIAGRFNANDVDLNRNFECDWQASGTWQNKTVSGGSEAFSEPESQAMRSYIQSHEPSAVVVWYSAAGGVFASSCHNGVLAETSALTKLYANASGYKAYEDFNFYEITGDMVNWLAKEKIPAISVLLTNHQDTEWKKNEAGIKALLDYYKE
jgi:hypothetical protein